jgi:hypothetical protein
MLFSSYGTSDVFGIESLWESDRPLLRVRSRYLKYTLQSDIMISAYPLEKAQEDSHDAFIDMGLGMRCDIDYYSPVIASLGLNFCFF